MITIEELNQVTTEDLAGINVLLPQLSATAKPMTYQDLLNVVRDNAVTILVAREGKRVVGIGSLILFHSVLGTRARLEEMVVDEGQRGNGIGRLIAERLIEIARKNRVRSIELSSRPNREAANALYQKLGFEKKETNVYTMRL